MSIGETKKLAGSRPNQDRRGVRLTTLPAHPVYMKIARTRFGPGGGGWHIAVGVGGCVGAAVWGGVGG